jgi:hypothetical protein
MVSNQTAQQESKTEIQRLVVELIKAISEQRSQSRTPRDRLLSIAFTDAQKLEALIFRYEL